MKPLVSAVNATPRFTADPSPESATDGVADPSIVHGQAGAEACGVAGFDAPDAGPAPAPFVADTVNVYVVPLVSPLTVVEVAGGLPDTVLAGCADDPMYGVTV